MMCATQFEGNGPERHLRHGQQPELTPAVKGQPQLHPFWAAGFSFARGHFVILVPYDQYLPMVFQGTSIYCVVTTMSWLSNAEYSILTMMTGEEISIGLRAFTHGYDFYAST